MLPVYAAEAGARILQAACITQGRPGIRAARNLVICRVRNYNVGNREMAAVALAAVAVTAAAGIPDAHSTHVSVPVLTAGGDLEYLFADDLIIAGWVEYGGSPTPDVLLNIRVSDPDRTQVSETFVTSDSNGEFEYAFGLPEGSMPGDYSVTVTSMCWEQHRQICTHRTAQATVSVPEAGAGPGVHIPEWVKTVAGFWVDGQIDDDGFVRAVGFLIRSGVIVIGDSGETNHGGSGAVPDWIRTSTGYWVSGDVSDDEFAAGIEWLVGSGIIPAGT